MGDQMADDFLSYMVYFFGLMNFHGIESKLFMIYVVMYKYFFHAKNPKNSKRWKKILQKNQFFHEKNT